MLRKIDCVMLKVDDPFGNILAILDMTKGAIT